MRVVLDTNVIVSALINPEGTPAAVVALVVAGEVRPLLDPRLLAEYREVLSRPRFGFDPDAVEAVVAALVDVGEIVEAPALAIQLPDPDDLAFLEVAVAGGADAIVTGNTRDFPAASCPVPILTPAALLERLGTLP